MKIKSFFKFLFSDFAILYKEKDLHTCIQTGEKKKG